MNLHEKQGIAENNSQRFLVATRWKSVRLRTYQQQMVDKIAQAAKRARAILATLPTGAGKTTVMAELVRRMLERGLRIYCVVHRIELVEQIVARLAMFGIKAGVIAAGVKPDPDCMVQVCMVQS